MLIERLRPMADDRMHKNVAGLGSTFQLMPLFIYDGSSVTLIEQLKTNYYNANNTIARPWTCSFDADSILLLIDES